MMNSRTVVALLLTLAATSEAFVAPASRKSSVAATTTELQFGIPTFGAKQYDGDDKKKKKDDDVPEKKIDLSGLVQLITAGMGSPFLGNFEGVEEETGKMMFSLEANNLVDENGESKQTKMPYFESGWVDPEDAKKASAGFKFPWDK